SIGLSAHYLERGSMDAAVEHAVRAVALAPGMAAAHANLGFVALQGKRWEVAESSYRAAIALSPYEATSFNNLGLALEQQGRLSEAREQILNALALDPAMPGFRRNLDRVESKSP
ncbi:MAG: tetratricopeptide repeat protein, partial [Gammaproteobacteria bacterium]